MSFYGNKWSSTFSKVGKKRKFRVGTDGKMVAVKQKTTAIPKKKPIKKEYKKISEEEMIDQDMARKTESMIRQGYPPRGSDIQREVNYARKTHPLNKEGRDAEAARKRYLEFRQAKINTAIKNKRRKN